MKFSHLKIAFLAVLVSADAPLAAADSISVRNCTWCHVTSAQGSLSLAVAKPD
jgi:hypothetical protein